MKMLLIKGAHLLDPQRPLTVADIRIEDGRITEISPRLSATGAEVVEARNMLAMPGLINSHTHSDQSLDRGTTPNLPLDLWIAWAVFGSAPRTPDDSYTVAAAGALEMLRTGTTSVIDHVYVDPDQFSVYTEAIVTAYEDLGLRAGVAPGVADLPFAESLPGYLISDGSQLPTGSTLNPSELADHLENFIATYKSRHPRIEPMLGPSAPQRCSDGFLSRIVDLGRRYNVGIHTHLLESKSQVLAGRHRYGQSTVAHIDDIGLLSPQTSLAHSVWVDDEDIELISKRGSTVVHNPWSNLRCGSGLMPMTKFVAAGVEVALGSDGAASNDSQNMFEVLKLATGLQTMSGGYREWPTAQSVWHGSLRGGATALGLPIGRLEVGAYADIVLLNLDRHVLVDREQLAASLVFAELGQSVDTVIVHGEVVVRAGHSILIDEAALGTEARRFQRRQQDNAVERRAEYQQWFPGLDAIENKVGELDIGIERRLQNT